MGWFASLKRWAASSLVASLEERIRRFEESGDETAVLSAQALAEAQRLWAVTERRGHIEPTPEGVDALSVLARLHWARHQASGKAPQSANGVPDEYGAPANGLPEHGEVDDYREALALSRELYGLAPERVPSAVMDLIEGEGTTTVDDLRVMDLQNVASEALSVFTRDGRLENLDRAVNGLDEALSLVPVEHPRRYSLLSTLAGVLRLRSEVIERAEDLDRAVILGQEAAAAVPVGHPDRRLVLFNLATAFRLRHERSAGAGAMPDGVRPDDLDHAVKLMRESVRGLSPRIPGYARMQIHLGICLRLRSFRGDAGSDTDDAVAACREATRSCRTDDAQAGLYQMELGNALLNRYLRAGRDEDLVDAIGAFQGCLRYAEAGEAIPHVGLARCNLAVALRIQSGITGKESLLEEALRIVQQALGECRPGDPQRALYLENVSLCLLACHERTGDVDLLNRAIVLGQEAVDVVPVGDVRRTGYQVNLSSLYRTRFRRTGDRADLATAADLVRRAVDEIPEGHTSRTTALSTLASVLEDEFHLTGDRTVLEQAVAAARSAVTAAAYGDPSRASLLVNLSGVLLALADVPSPGRHDSGGGADSDNLASIIDQAVAAAREAVELLDPDHPDRLICQSTLAKALWRRRGHDEVGRPGASLGTEPYGESIRLMQSVVDQTPAEHPALAYRLNRLGQFWLDRYRCTESAEDLERARAAFQDAVGVTTAPVDERVRAAGYWGGLAAAADRMDEAIEGFRAAVQLLPQVAWVGLNRANQEDRLREWSWLTADAAACAVLGDRPDVAVEFLEYGRSLLWTQALDLRTPLDELADVAPDLAHRLDQVRRALDVTADGSYRDQLTATCGLGAAAAGLGTDRVSSIRALQARATADRARLAKEWEDLLTQARGLEGFADFLAPPPYTQLRRAAANGPVVLVNVSQLGSHALIVAETEQVDVVPLDLDVDVVKAQVDELQGILSRAGSRDHSFLEVEQDRYTVLDLLAWLWEVVAEPVLVALGHSQVTADGALPRMWWCPTGPLALLPLHAAGRHPRTATAPRHSMACVMDRVVPSYTPTLRALTRTRRGPSEPVAPRQFVVGMTTTPGLPDLPHVPDEIQVAARAFPASYLTEQICPPEATRDRVREGLRSSSWAHLACHAVQDVDDPSYSGFALCDGRLTLADLAGEHLSQADFAFLSACETAAGTAGLPDEALHLAAALLFVGYRHVIASLWAVNDALAPVVAASVYEQLTNTGTPSPADTARALHAATQAIRDEYPADPLLWGCYAHFGP